jgi:hypothetical protein
VRDAKSRFAGSAPIGDTGRPLRRAGRLGVLLLALGALGALAAPPALAFDPGHAYSYSFTGSGTNLLQAPVGGDVDNSSGPSNGALYISDSTTRRVEKFDAAGNFLFMFGDEVNATTGGDICPVEPSDVCKAGNTGSGAQQLANPQFVAVDNSSGPSKGDVYVLDTTSLNIHKYDPSGNLITTWGASGAINGPAFPDGGFTGTMMGIDVDSNGIVYVANTANPLKYWKFNEDGSGAGSVVWQANSFASGQFGFAVDQNGNQFKARNTGTISRSTTVPAPPLQITNTGLLNGGRIGVDPVSGTLYGATFSAGFNEYKFNEGGQPVDALGVPCSVTLVNNGGGCPPTRSFVTSNILSANTKAIAINSTTGYLYAVDQTNKKVAVYVPGQIPLVTTSDPVANTKVSGSVTLDGAGPTQACFFEFGTTTAYNKTQPCEPGTPYVGDQAVTAVLPGLTNETLYHYRLVAKGTAGGFNFGADKTILPHNVPNLKTEPADEITRTSARLNAWFEGNGEATTYYFDYGEGTGGGYTTRIPLSPTEESAGSPSEPTTISTTLPGLKYDTSYHFRVVAKNGKGSSLGQDRTFKTLPAVPNLTSGPATNILPHSATLNGSYEGNGELTTYYYEYGKTTSYTGGKSETFEPGSPSGPTNLEPFDISSLELETLYHFRVVATNPVGTTKGPDQTFTTLPAVGGLKTLPADEISQDGIRLNAEFNGDGDDTYYYFEYGLTSKYGKSTAEPPGDEAGAPVGVTPLHSMITDYEAYSTYHFRVVAENSEGITKSPDATFETLAAPLPGIVGPTVSDISPSGATLEAEINPNRWATVYLFEYGPTPAYGGATEISQPIGSDNTEHPVSEEVSGLAPGTMYHLRAVAINFTGTAYSADQVFFTPAAPRIELTSSSGVAQSSAHLSASVSPNSAATMVHFDYGTSTAYGASTGDVPAGADPGVHSVGMDVAGLEAGTTYHFRAVAGNVHGTTFGPDQTFTTQAKPAEEVVPPPPPKKCKKGFVKKNGKCVKKKKKKKKKKNKRQSTRRHG